MPYETHPLFEAPSNPQSKIWRYMSFTKFMSLLDSGCLYFTRGDNMAAMDPYEGSYTHANARGSNEIPWGNMDDGLAKRVQSGQINFPQVMQVIRAVESNAPSEMYLNC